MATMLDGGCNNEGVRVYVASPLGFSVPTKMFYESVLLPALAQADVEVLDPWTASFPAEATTDELTDLNRAVAEANVLMIERSEGVFAVLDGSDVDSGTAAEIGYAAAIGRPVVGWRSDLRTAGDNVAAVVNLQVQYFIERSGGGIERDLDAAVARLVGRLRG